MRNEVARWAALQDPAFAVPLKGAPSKIAQTFGLSASEASDLLLSGLGDGRIALQDADTGHVLLPSASALTQQVDWASGQWTIPGLAPKMLVIHWPDVERAAKTDAKGRIIEGEAIEKRPKALTRFKPKQEAVDAWMIAAFAAAWEAGRPPPKRDEKAFPDCRAAIGATDLQMKAAMQKVPAEHKRGRGHRDR